MASFKKIKVRKNQQCEYCNKTIIKGNEAEFMKFRTGKFINDIQVGIQYCKVYLHFPNDICLKEVNNG